MDWRVEQVVDATGGRAGTVPPGYGPWTAVGIDSRAVTAGTLFVPIRAERDGHGWIHDAVAAGATGYLCDPDGVPAVAPPGAVAVEVADTGAALLDLGRAARRRLEGTVVGITGSVGKTSTKDLVAAVLGPVRRVTANVRSFNNELGVPLTLVNAPESTEVAVVEMGARGPGHIRLLCDVAGPQVGVVTAVAPAHTEAFGSVDGVAAAKGELVESLPPTGLAVLNADDGRVAAMAGRATAPVATYSAAARPGADAVAEDVVVDDDLRPRFQLRSAWGDVPVLLGARGVHQVGNALAAAVVALHLGCTPEEVAAGLSRAHLSPHRMDLRRSATGALVLDDAYNANPASMAAALRSLVALPARRRVAVLGGMAELGPDGPDQHLGVAALAGSLGVEVVAVGTAAYGVAPVPVEEIPSRLGPLGDGDAVLVKASRVEALERVAARLLGSA